MKNIIERDVNKYTELNIMYIISTCYNFIYDLKR